MRLRDVFLSVAGHELRTPLNALKLQLYALAAIAGAARRTPKSWTKAEHEVDRLADLTIAFWTSRASRPEASRSSSPRTDLVDWSGDVVARMQADAAMVGSRIEVSAPPLLVGRWDRASSTRS